MKYLLDTHVLIWSALNPERLSRRAAVTINDVTNILFLSAVTAWEIATKVRLGKLPGAESLERDLLAVTTKSGYTWLGTSPEVALKAGRLLGLHKDPFDRMIAAQALEMDIDVISNDAALDAFGVRRIW